MPKPKSVLQIQAVWRIMPQFLAACVAPRLFWLVPGKERKHLHLHLQHHPMKTQIDRLIIPFLLGISQGFGCSQVESWLDLGLGQYEDSKGVQKVCGIERATSRVDGDLNRIYHVWSKHFFHTSLTDFLTSPGLIQQGPWASLLGAMEGYARTCLEKDWGKRGWFLQQKQIVNCLMIWRLPISGQRLT